jgi:hypothetical protein
MGGVGETAVTLNVKLCDLIGWWWLVVVASYRHLAQSFIYTEIKSRHGN